MRFSPPCLEGDKNGHSQKRKVHVQSISSLKNIASSITRSSTKHTGSPRREVVFREKSGTETTIVVRS